VVSAQDVLIDVGGHLLGRSTEYHIHTFTYTIPVANITPSKRELPDERVCIGHPGSSYPVPVNSKSIPEFSRRVVW
jgi:hypothetical protein